MALKKLMDKNELKTFVLDARDTVSKKAVKNKLWKYAKKVMETEQKLKMSLKDQKTTSYDIQLPKQRSVSIKIGTIANRKVFEEKAQLQELEREESKKEFFEELVLRGNSQTPTLKSPLLIQ